MAEATVVITTRNRRDELRRAIESALAQDCRPTVLVIDDASEDGTAEMVAAEFPSVSLHREERPAGCVVRRNQAASLASTSVMVSIDDDAWFASSTTVSQTLRDLDHPRVGAVAIPYVDVVHGPSVRQKAPATSGVHLTSSFIGTAYAVKREVFLAVGGYREALVGQTEEVELCLRMLDAGYVTRLGRGEPLMHEESTARDRRRQTYRGIRNDLLHGWNNVPMPFLLVRLFKASLYQAMLSLREGHFRVFLRASVAAHRIGIRGFPRRKPVSRATYLVDHAIRKKDPLTLEAVENCLSSVRS